MADEATPPDDGGLFPPPARSGRMRAAMVEQIEAWQSAGRAIGPATRAALIMQAEALDLAMSIGKATQVSGANRVLVDMLTAHRLVDETPAGGAPLDRFLAQIEAAANGAGG